MKGEFTHFKRIKSILYLLHPLKKNDFLELCIFNEAKNKHKMLISRPLKSNTINGFYLPFLFAGEKKLKTGENMVPNNVVLGGLPEEGLSSNFPFCFTC